MGIAARDIPATMNRRARGVFAALLSALVPLLLFVLPLFSQPAPPTQDPSVLNSLDSLKRVITRRILSDADKKEIRACDREKSQSLKQCRSGDAAHAEVDRKIMEAKQNGSDPNDPAIQALLEKKFALEKACDDAFAALPRGKQCLAGENKRRAALEKALRLDKSYQAMLKKSQAAGPETL